MKKKIEAPRAKARGIFGPNSFNPSKAEKPGIHSQLESRGFLRRRNKPLKVFFNASVILAGLGSPQGGSAKLLKLTKQEKITGSISEIVFEETIRHSKKIGLTEKNVKNKLLLIFRNISLAPAKSEVENFKKIVLDYGDSHIFASCRENGVDFLVTLDKKHLLILDGKIKSLKIVSPGQLLKILSGAK